MLPTNIRHYVRGNSIPPMGCPPAATFWFCFLYMIKHAAHFSGSLRKQSAHMDAGAGDARSLSDKKMLAKKRKIPENIRERP